MVAQHLAGLLAAAEAPAGQPALLGDDEIDRAVAADRQHVVVLAEVRVGLAVLHVGPVAAEVGEDRLLGLGVLRHLTRQRQQRHRLLQRDVGGQEVLRQRGALGLLALRRLAKLDVGAEAPIAQRDLQLAVGVKAQHLGATGLCLDAVGLADLARVLAFGIVRASDERAELAELQR